MTPTTFLDLHWAGHARSIASALLRSGDGVALVDPGPSSTIPNLREQLAVHGLGISDLDALFLTHIHLDHAGASGSLVRENPRLRVYVHSRGAPHMADPSKLLDSARRLYGNTMQRLYGEFLAVPQANLNILEGGETLSVGSRELQVVYTPGHASHHVTYFDASEGLGFVGDTAGIAIDGHPFILPATPPPDINLELWNSSLDAIAALNPKRLFLTHFGFSNHPARHIASYRERLLRWSDLVAKILTEGADDSQSSEAFVNAIAAEARESLPREEVDHYLFNGALHLSWLGLARYHRKRAAAPA
ncbi:MAG TPA: MBL fold metallo-hydrolase [Verrucomicrobiae bacterium]|nr:MBL fold metallo-hydrolase [Verrucomicrobiae bacterium]